jgi:hypothetical protein
LRHKALEVGTASVAGTTDEELSNMVIFFVPGKCELQADSSMTGVPADGELSVQDRRNCGVERLVDKAERRKLPGATDLGYMGEPTKCNMIMEVCLMYHVRSTPPTCSAR